MSSHLSDLYEVRRIRGGIGKEYIRANHYSRTCHNGPMTWGLFEKGDTRLIGVCAFATPNSENVRRAPFGHGHENEVTELHRLHIIDGTPTNTESWMIRRALAGLVQERPQLRAVLTFADSTEGHTGVIYQATNAIYAGMTGRARFWRDTEGRLRHPRQNGHNITPDEAAAKGWTPEWREAKHRYVYLVGTPSTRRHSRRELRLKAMPYPKHMPSPPSVSVDRPVVEMHVQPTLFDSIGAVA